MRRQPDVRLWLLGLVMGVLGCVSPYDLTCEDTLSPEQATFLQVQALIVQPGVTSCSRCHNTQTPIRNLNFEGPGVAYDALTTRRASVYEQVASRRMPQGGPAWTEEQLRVLRSWYCAGAPYAP